MNATLPWSQAIKPAHSVSDELRCIIKVDSVVEAVSLIDVALIATALVLSQHCLCTDYDVNLSMNH